MTRETKLPKHVAVIMDGNGRWAKSKGLPRIEGHKAGGETLRKLVRRAGELGLEHFSVYAFSTENWNRPPEEVSGLMKILVDFCKGEVAELKATNTRLKFLGDIESMPLVQKQAIKVAQAALSGSTGMQLNICMNYGSRNEMVNAVKTILKSGLKPDQVDEDTISNALYTRGIPDPELLIRTSGEQRISNFFLWQIAYTEFVFVDKHWPEMEPEDLDACLERYYQRDRRFGKV